MNNVKDQFSIKDLENLSGIKAHTIRIWEKRYNLLKPNRTDTNIRYYSLESLQKLLNVTFLNNNGYKISKISKIKEEDISSVVRDIVSENSAKNNAINSFKLSMINFDQVLFFNTYNNLLKEKSFRDIIFEVFIPLLNEIGLLWQTNTITPSHEHFISSLIKQKILINTEKLQRVTPTNKNKTFVLYLPDNEIHELGLMYLQYEILLHDYQCVFLGQSIQIDNLKNLAHINDNVVFVSYFTVKPDKDLVNKYLQDFNKKLLGDDHIQLWALGRMLEYVNTDELPKNIKTFNSIKEFITQL